jgi:hypothetical protein
MLWFVYILACCFGGFGLIIGDTGVINTGSVGIGAFVSAIPLAIGAVFVAFIKADRGSPPNPIEVIDREYELAERDWQGQEDVLRALNLFKLRIVAAFEKE